MQQANDRMVSDEKPRAGWRVKTGLVIFVVSILWPVVVPVLPLVGVSTKSTAAFVGFMVVAAELTLVDAAAIAGKDGFAYIKSKVFGLLKSFGPPRKVSRTRYIIGLLMFAAPIVFAWASPYFGHHIAGLDEHQRTYAIVGDVMLLASLFVLGGDFWDKLRSLFLHKAYAVIWSTGSDSQK